MIKVYFESSSHSELVATFQTEELFMECLPVLQAEAEKQNCIVTESIE